MKITKKILSFVTAFAITGTMLSYMPVIREELGYDTSMYTASADELGSDNTGGTGSSSSGLSTLSKGCTTGQSRTGLLVYPIVLPSTDNGVIEPSDFVDFDRWAYAQKYGAYVEKNSSGKICAFNASTNNTGDASSVVTYMRMQLHGKVLNLTQSAYIDSYADEFSKRILNAFINSNFYGNHYNDISEALNAQIEATTKEAFYESWRKKVNVIDSDSAIFAKAIAENRFMWGVEILGEISDSNSGIRYMMPVSDMCAFRANEITTNDIIGKVGTAYKSIAIASEIVAGGNSFAPLEGSSPSYAFTYYINAGDNYGAIGCLRPNVENDKWTDNTYGGGCGFGGWGLITVNAGEITLSPTNVQFIETATLIAGTDTGYQNISRDDLIEYNPTAANLEKDKYKQNGVVANFINRVSSPWENRAGRRYVLTYTDTNKSDKTDVGAYPWSMVATSPLAGTTFNLQTDTMLYKAVLSDGSAETDWIAIKDLGNGARGMDTNAKDLIIITEGTHKGKTVQQAAVDADKDIFFIANAVYVYEGLSDDSFKAVEIPENKLTQRSETLLNFINSNKVTGYWRSNSIGSLYGQLSDVGIPEFNVDDNNFFNKGLLNKETTSSAQKCTYFIASTADEENHKDGDKATNIKQYYTNTVGATLKDFNPYISVENSQSSLDLYLNTTDATTDPNYVPMVYGSPTEMQSGNHGYAKPLYNDETTRYRFNQTGTDGATLVSRNGLGDNINIASFSKFTFDIGSKSAVAAYGYTESNVPATRGEETTGNAGFVRASSAHITDSDVYTNAHGSPVPAGLSFKRAPLFSRGATVTEAGMYTGFSVEGDFGTTHITGEYKKASVDTLLKASNQNYPGSSSSWSDSTNSMTDKGFTTTSSSTFKFYPEVEMQYDTLTDTDKNIYVVGDGIKEVKPLIYSTFGIDTGSTKIDSTAIAVDKRAKALAKKVATDETPVYLPGGILSGTTQDMKLTINSYVLDLNVDGATKNAWGNADYNPLNDVKAAIENKVSKVGITQKLVVKDKDTEKGTFGISDGSEEVEVKEIGTPVKAKDYNFFVQDGEITFHSSISYTTKADGTVSTMYSVDEDEEFAEILEQLKVQDVIDTVLAQNKGTGAWYTEDTSILKISMYETAVALPGIAFSDKLPLDAGPETADKKDDQYNKGYKAYITAGIKIKDADDNEYVIGESEATGDPSFVIPNVTVVDVAQ